MSFQLQSIESESDQYELLWKVFSPPLEENLKMELLSIFSTCSFEKGDFLVEAGEHTNNLYFICTGTAYGFQPQAEKDAVVALAYQRDLIASLASITQSHPSTFSIVAQEPILALVTTFDQLNELFDKHRSLESWFLQATFRIIAGMEIRLAAQALTAEERFQRLWNDSRHVFQLFPQRIIASYLSMTPETLSRLRKQS